MHDLAVGEARQPHLRDVRTGEPVRDQSPDGVAVAKALMEVAHVEMGVERDQSDSLQRQAQPEHSRSRHGIVATDEQRQRVERCAELDSVADGPRSLLDGEPGEFHIAPIGHPRR